ncbi:TerC family protein [Evansella cellulosilytica]|uniref:Integral membrane protein TerC n=1 Tax=Evansella cellulosilytica (strain ATCC 21833 / DSM 2522 / FERM P-1141 / JCM 9156 / N-4) TaxID=649639 RepID=E6TX66_EVAC2|nr:TerC family protein [Evansella cellulosilytica]ADU31155.1 Integral membrane protein TerC [Evansella cellulosilytica DSM 2522]
MSSEFIISLLTIIGIDIILGGDNAIVVALACRKLPPHLRNKAIIAGIMLAIAARAILTLVAVQLLAIPYLMSIGGILLLWIAFKLMTNTEEDHDIRGEAKVSDAIKTIVVADVVMGFDNVLAVAGAANGNGVLVLIGLLVSVPIIIWGSKLILYLMTKFSFIIYIGASILVYTAAKMILHEAAVSDFIDRVGVNATMFTILLVVLTLLGGWLYNRKALQS